MDEPKYKLAAYGVWFWRNGGAGGCSGRAGRTRGEHPPAEQTAVGKSPRKVEVSKEGGK
jgi:hypothetical protein